MIVPEQIVRSSLDKIFDFIKSDFDNAAQEEDTYIYKVLGLAPELKLTDRYEFYKQSKVLFTSAPDSRRRLKTHLFYNAERAAAPSVHIMAASDSPTPSGIGLNEGAFDDEDTLNSLFQRAYNSQIPIVFTSDNPSEVLLMFYFVRQLIIPMFNHFEQEGMKNCSVSSAPVFIEEHLVPKGLFMKQMTLSFYNEVNSVNFYRLAEINGLNFIQIIQDAFSDNSVSG